MGNNEHPLARELAFFEAMRAEWLKHYEGQFVLVHGKSLVGAFSTFEQAVNAGVSHFGIAPFLVRKVVAVSAEGSSTPALSLGLIYARP